MHTGSRSVEGFRQHFSKVSASGDVVVVVLQPQPLELGPVFDSQRARNKGHHAALRAPGNRWLEVCGTA